MNLADLNAKIDRTQVGMSLTMQMHHREALRYMRDERLGILGCVAGQEPTAGQIAIVHQQLFGELPCLF